MTAQFANLNEFLAMGGYAGFVWAAYGIMFLSIIILAINAFASQKHWQKRIEEIQTQIDKKTQNANKEN